MHSLWLSFIKLHNN